ncbi:MAG: response regulator transcription factor [Prevotella sp.]|jgi:DNA-binding LytR/AlgR family response regulator|nr:response regulator transcription factor [Prevotella sp.]
MTLNCVIIDDEPLAADLLASYARKTPFLNLIGAYNNAVEAMKGIRENNVHLVFLDIQMPDLGGIELAKILPKDTKVVFTTAFSQYAIDSYKVNTLDYLLKPISYEEFVKAADKALEWFTKVNPSMKLFNKDRFIYVKSDYKMVQIKYDDIIYIEGVKDYVKIFTDNGDKPVMSLMNMKKFEENLPQPEFLRTHRSYIVHMTKVKLIDKFHIAFGKELIPISDTYKEDIQNYFDLHTLS